MTQASLSSEGDGKAQLAGVLDFSSVPQIWPDLQRLIEREPQLELSLAGVTSSNSAALALLLEAVQLSHASQGKLVLRDIPTDLTDLAGLSNLAPLLDS